ncbi:hypothetical protein ABPG74_015734 [Tetrahymena malaccensis]
MNNNNGNEFFTFRDTPTAQPNRLSSAYSSSIQQTQNQPKSSVLQNSSKVIFNPRKYERSGFSIDQIVEMKQTFDMFDKDKGGTLSYDELKEAMQILGFVQEDDVTLDRIIEAIDINGDGQLGVILRLVSLIHYIFIFIFNHVKQFEEFMNLMFANIAENDSDADLQKAFSYFIDLGNQKFLQDDDDDEIVTFRSSNKKQQSKSQKKEQNILKSKITIQMLRNIAKEIGEDVEDEDLIEMLERADKDDDGQVGFQDFKYIIKWQSEETKAEFEQQDQKQSKAQKAKSYNNISQEF